MKKPVRISMNQKAFNSIVTLIILGTLWNYFGSKELVLDVWYGMKAVCFGFLHGAFFYIMFALSLITEVKMYGQGVAKVGLAYDFGYTAGLFCVVHFSGKHMERDTAQRANDHYSAYQQVCGQLQVANKKITELAQHIQSANAAHQRAAELTKQLQIAQTKVGQLQGAHENAQARISRLQSEQAQAKAVQLAAESNKPATPHQKTEQSSVDRPIYVDFFKNMK